MSQHNSTTLPASGKPAAPTKPYPGFPSCAHAARVRAKKIRGKVHSFGPWYKPDAALAE